MPTPDGPGGRSLLLQDLVSEHKRSFLFKGCDQRLVRASHRRVWGRQHLSPLSKGRLVYIGGRLPRRTWIGQDGVSRYALEIIADEIQFLTPKPHLASVKAVA